MAFTLAKTTSSYLSAEEEADFVEDATALERRLRRYNLSKRCSDSVPLAFSSYSKPEALKKIVGHDLVRLDSNTAKSTATTSQAGTNNTVNVLRTVRPVHKCPAKVKADTTDPCNGYRKKLYKTPRGLREHLYHKHGWTRLEADSEARSAFGAGSELVTIPHPIQQATHATFEPQNLYGQESELESGITVSDVDDSTHWNDRFDGWSSSV